MESGLAISGSEDLIALVKQRLADHGLSEHVIFHYQDATAGWDALGNGSFASRSPGTYRSSAGHMCRREGGGLDGVGGVSEKRRAGRMWPGREDGAGYKREIDGEDASNLFLTVDLDGAAMLVNDLAHAGEADAATGNTADDIPTAGEALEDVRQICSGNAKAMVLDAQDGDALVGALFQGDGDDDVSAIRAELDGVGEKVVQDALEAPGVPFTGDNGVVRLNAQRVTGGCALVCFDARLGEGDQIGIGEHEGQGLAGADARDVQQFVHQALHASSGGLNSLEGVYGAWTGIA
jgi:hypothetical protein